MIGAHNPSLVYCYARRQETISPAAGAITAAATYSLKSSPHQAPPLVNRQDAAVVLLLGGIAGRRSNGAVTLHHALTESARTRVATPFELAPIAETQNQTRQVSEDCFHGMSVFRQMVKKAHAFL
jgi:hypothetical protein